MKKKLFRFAVGLGVVMGFASALLGICLAPTGWAEEVEGSGGAVGGDGGGIVEEKKPEIYIRAVNPGYTIDGKSNVGEMIEIGRVGNSDEMISLAGVTIDYTNSSGNTAVLAQFPEHSFLAGETILLRLASSPEHELAAMNYTKTLAFKAGPLSLRRGEEILDTVCWSGGEGCFSEFSSTNPTTLFRENYEAEFSQIAGYEPVYDSESFKVEGFGGAEEVLPAQCRGLQFSEILSYYEESAAEQFIEFYNSGAEQILLDGCQIKYKNKFYPLSGVVPAEGYFVRLLSDFSLTKNPSAGNVLELVDVNGETVDRLEYPNGQRKGASYMMVGYDEAGEEIWRVSYAPTPGEANNYQEFKSCEVGKVINPETGNCVKVAEVVAKTCPAGQYLNPLTGRCRKVVATTGSEAKSCKEGYELNPETGRCRKVKENTGANYSLEPETYEEQSNFVAIYIVVGIVAVGAAYLIYEFRAEIKRFLKRLGRKVSR